MQYLARLTTLLLNDPLRMTALEQVPAECWIGAGFIRDAVWDALHAAAPQPITGDVDVIHLDSYEDDEGPEQRLRQQAPVFRWSVKNQARMHLRNGDAPYVSIEEALRHWPETATAVAVRLTADKTLQVIAPFGLDDLFQLYLRPTPRFRGEKHPIFQQRVAEKGWLTRYPKLRLIT